MAMVNTVVYSAGNFGSVSAPNLAISLTLMLGTT